MIRFAQILCIVVLLAGFALPGTANAQTPVVRAVLFFSPTCPHCEQVITEHLPPLWEQYGGEPEVTYIPPAPEEQQLGPAIIGIAGDQLEILYVNTTTSIGSDLFRTAVEQFQIPENERVVPTLLVGDLRLVGSIDIPEQFPDIIANGLQTGGIDWPPLPGLSQHIATLVPVPTEEPSPAPTSETDPLQSTVTPVPPAPPIEIGSSSMTMLEKFALDPVGNSLSVIILIGMVASVLFVGYRLVTPPLASRLAALPWVIPVLTLIGMAIAGYLTYVEATGTEAACGPVGDCNTVQQSPYAMLLGTIPVGGMGLLGTIGLLAAWIIARVGSGKLANAATMALFGMAAFGTLFSIYLTFLEPFVIGATCIWCLTSAIIMTAIFLLTTNAAILAFRTWQSQS